MLLNSCGKATYHLIRNLVSPARPATTAYSVICQKFRQHFNSKPTVTVQRYKFNTRSQEQGEDIATFVSKLRELAEHCEFGANLDDHLRDRLVRGVAEERIKHRLFTEPTLTFQRALEIARNIETASKKVAVTKSHSSLTVSPSATAHKVQAEEKARSTSRPTAACFRCRATNHTPVPGTRELLWPVPTSTRNHPGTTVWAVEQTGNMALGEQTKEGFSGCKGGVSIITSASSFRSIPGSRIIM